MSSSQSESEPLPLDSKDYIRRLTQLEELSVNSIYGEFLDGIRIQKEAIMKSVFVTPKSVEGILARERFLGIAEEYEVLLAWLDNEISDTKLKIEQLKLEEQQEKEQVTNHEN